MKATLFVLSFAGLASCWNNGQGRVPPMGWTADFAYDCNTINEELVKNTSAYMAVNGLVAAGYKYVNVGECWMNLKREANGSLIADPTRFPNGLAGLY